MITLEKDIEQKFGDWVKHKGGLSYKWEGSRKKLDRIVVTNNGTILLIEFKKPGGKPTTHQKALMKELDYHKAPYLITDDLKKAQHFYREHCA